MLDGCKIVWLASPKEIKGTAGKANELVCSIMELGDPDASGRRSSVDTGETFSLVVDMVIKAAGQMPFESLVNEFEIQNSKGKINIKDSVTNIPGVFAGGDCVNGGKEVVDAVQAGKDGAKAVLFYLSNNLTTKSTK
jgi:glutamate synthase (NADPH/NADH) small chain